MRQLLTERYRERLAGVLSCYDRIIVTGTLPGSLLCEGNDGISFCATDPDLRHDRLSVFDATSGRALQTALHEGGGLG